MKLSIISALLATAFGKAPVNTKPEPALYDVSELMQKMDRQVVLAGKGKVNWEQEDFIGDGQGYDRTKLYDDDYVPGDVLIPRRPIDSREKEKWIYGKKTEIGEHELARLEKMWVTDLELARFRGFLQGWTRGFYSDYDYEIPKKCFGREANLYFYYIDLKLENLDFANFIEIFMLMYNTYYMFDYNCDIEQHLYDLSNFCFNHDCNPEQLLKNEMGKVFQVTGSMNQLAAIFYEEEPLDDQHLAWFDMYNEVGLSIGKVSRYTLGYDPRSMNIHEDGTDENDQDNWRDRD